MLKIAIGQKLMLDIRYFDTLDNTQSSNENSLLAYQPPKESIQESTKATTPKKPQTQLESSVAKLLADYNISGVILFSENLVDAPQINKLTDDIKQVATSSLSGEPLIISIDQEGGRVARLPRNQWPAFTGNMAIGAQANDAEKMSYRVGEAIGQQLQSLGINVNHAPTVDVNANPNNPVINVRSFGDCPKHVANLGSAMGKGMIAAGIIPTFKHFPGHGDTNVDSHTGLPRVDHDLDIVNTVDLFPFVDAINKDCAPMIMTAHIQYPALDNSTFLARNGEDIVKPATLSYDILTTLLRDKLRYKGVVITDALDMASISCYLTPVQAVIETFKAGADIALMPLKVHKPADILAFDKFFNDIVEQIIGDTDLYTKIMASYHRIQLMKKDYILNNPAMTSPSFHKKLQTFDHRALEQHIANHSIISHGNTTKLELSDIKHVVTVFNTVEQGMALINGLQKCNVLAQSIEYRNVILNDIDLIIDDPKNTLLIVGIEDVKSVVDVGGVDDLSNAIDKPLSGEVILRHLVTHKEQGGQSVFICLKAPYNLACYTQNATVSLTSFDGSVYQNDVNEWQGASFNAVASIITQQFIPTGLLPINKHSTH